MFLHQIQGNFTILQFLPFDKREHFTFLGIIFFTLCKYLFYIRKTRCNALYLVYIGLRRYKRIHCCRTAVLVYAKCRLLSELHMGQSEIDKLVKPPQVQ